MGKANSFPQFYYNFSGMKDAPTMPVGQEIFWAGLLLIVLGITGSIIGPAPYAGLYGIFFGVGACGFWWVNACEFKKKVCEAAEAEAQLLRSAESNTALANPSNSPTSEAAHNSEEVAAIRWTETGEQRIIKRSQRPENIGNLELEIRES